MATQPADRQITARIPEAMFDELAGIADQEQRSLANLLRVIAMRYLEDRHARTSPAEPSGAGPVTASGSEVAVPAPGTAPPAE